ncbi:MAG: DUF2252 family protein [Verrucomicrobiota bacterium]
MDPNPFLHGFQPDAKNESLRLWLKRGKLAESDFNYFRGHADVFYRYWKKLELPSSPAVWSCGDVHVKNVGTYRGQNGIAYFDLDDFDDAALAPLHFDLGRATAGLYLTHGAEQADDFLRTYGKTLANGKPFHIEPECAKGPVKLLFDRVTSVTRSEFLQQWVKRDRIRDIPSETFRLPSVTRQRALGIFEAWSSRQEDGKKFEVMDVCGSTAGVGSLTRERYLVLIRGKRKPAIIDMKEAQPSGLAAAAGTPQPKWHSEAHRVATIQRFVQYMPINRLGWTDTTPSFVLTEFQPAEDRMDSIHLTKKEYSRFVRQWARLVAWAHLRVAGWKGSPTTDELMDFGRRFGPALQKRILTGAAAAAAQISEAYRQYRDTVVPEPGD